MSSVPENHPTIAAIETRYGGCRFRSRLEARWAVAFDHMGIKWEYEPQGFSLPSGPYLPDFWLPEVNGGCYFEVKPDDPNVQQDPRWDELATLSGRPVFIAFGLPYPTSESDDSIIHGARRPDGHIESLTPFHDGTGIVAGWDNLHSFCTCPTCGKVGIQFEARSERICSHTPRANDDYMYLGPRIVAAFLAARSARFEHGESGARRPASPRREPTATATAITITCPLARYTPGVVEQLKFTLGQHRGDDVAHIHVLSDSGTLAQAYDARVRVTPSLLADLKALLGPAATR